VVVGALLAVTTYQALVHGHVLSEWYGAHELWQTSPLYVVFRASAVVAVLGLIWTFEAQLQWMSAHGSHLIAWLKTFSHQSLAAYVTHLFVLYGTPVSRGLVRGGARFTFWQTCWISLALIVFTYCVVKLWPQFLLQCRRAIEYVHLPL